MKKFILSLFAACAFTLNASAQLIQYFEKVTEAPADWTGEYLIVRETSDTTVLVFDGHIADDLDVKNNCFEVPMTDGIIDLTDELAAATFLIANQADTAWSCQSKSGLYLGYNTFKYDADSLVENTLKCGPDNKYPLYITMGEEGKVNIQAKCGYYLRYNDDTKHNRFRFHAEGKKKAICLYRLVQVEAGVENLPIGENRIIDGALYSLPAGFYIVNGKLIYKR
ncbi:MAG: hypothetical protein MJZ89_01275 [Paludibacteraceae bacterium]|nr:hypothetical protein [Paludibacteraceae bacterium]